MATPLEIKICLHYYAMVDEYEGGAGSHWYSPAVQEALRRLHQDGLLSFSPSGEPRLYDRGPALECYVTALCSVPFPAQQWVIPQETQ